MDAAIQHLINTLSLQRNEAQDRHAQCLAQLNVLAEAKVEREKELQSQIEQMTADRDDLLDKARLREALHGN